ncbi:MAG: CarD family transcriptional regulator, partial [Dehalococcoidia bacterium]
MDLSALLPLVDEAVDIDRLRRRMAEHRALMVGVSDGAKATVLAALARDAGRAMLIIVPKPQHADALAEELQAWLGTQGRDRVMLFPERDALPYERLSPDPDDVRQRLNALDALAASAVISPIIVAPAAAVAQCTLTPEEARRSTIAIARGERINMQDFLRALDAGGYRIEPQVTAPGEASRRGGIVDVWPPAEDLPLRIELFGDDVESIRAFDAATQRSEAQREAVRIGPARELAIDPQRMRALADHMQVANLRGEQRQRFDHEVELLGEGLPFPGNEYYVPFLAHGSLLDHLPDDALLVVDEPADVASLQREHDEQAVEARRELEMRGELPHGMPAPQVPWPEIDEAIAQRPQRLSLSRWATGEAESGEEQAAVRLPFGPAAAYGGRLRALADELTQQLRRGQQVVIVSTQSRRLAQLLEEHDVFALETSAIASTPSLGRGALTMINGSLPHGWTVGEERRGLTLLTDAEVFGFSKQRRAPPRKGASRAAFLADLAPGEYVVHIEHGIARFAGLMRRGIDGEEKEFLELQYADG